MLTTIARRIAPVAWIALEAHKVPRWIKRRIAALALAVFTTIAGTSERCHNSDPL